MLHQRAIPVAVPLAGVEASRSFFSPCLEGSGRTLLWVAHVDGENRCIHLSGLERTGAGGALPASEILGQAASLGSAGLVLAHAPAGEMDIVPPADATATQALAVAAEALGCTVLDHLLFTSASCRSMRRMGLL